MNTPDPALQNVTLKVKKAEAWLGSNWYPFSIGAASCVVIVKVAHWIGFLKFL